MRLVVLGVLAIAESAHGDTIDAGVHATLRDVLGEATAIVRGSAIDTTRKGPFADTQFAVADTLRGDIEGETIIVRQPAGGEEPLDRGDDVILLLDARTADGVYPVHHPAGRYRVENGEDVIVNASGVDGATISVKDLRPRAPDERMPIDQFRMLAGGPRARRPDAAPSTLASPPPAAAHAAPTDTRGPAPAPQDSDPTRWPWLVAALALGAVLLYGALRAR